MKPRIPCENSFEDPTKLTGHRVKQDRSDWTVEVFYGTDPGRDGSDDRVRDSLLARETAVRMQDLADVEAIEAGLREQNEAAGGPPLS